MLYLSELHSQTISLATLAACHSHAMTTISLDNLLYILISTRLTTEAAGLHPNADFSSFGPGSVLEVLRQRTRNDG